MDKVIVGNQTAFVRLRLKGPVTQYVSRQISADINALIAHLNTMLFRAPSDEPVDGRITVEAVKHVEC
jgi:hypothetical protein